MYHHLASNTIRGPNIRIDIPTTMLIQQRQGVLPAIDRLKNHNKEDIDFDQFDAMFNQTYTPDSIDANKEFSMFVEQMNFLNQTTTESCKETFDTSLNDSEIPNEVMRGLQTRDVLNQLTEESCAADDYRGIEGTRALEEQLVSFRQQCNENPPGEGMGEDSEGHTDVILNVSTGRRKATTAPMTQTKYTSTVD